MPEESRNKVFGNLVTREQGRQDNCGDIVSLCQLGLDFAGNAFPGATLEVSLAGRIDDIVLVKIDLTYVSF